MGDLVEKYWGVPASRWMAGGSLLKMPMYLQKLEQLGVTLTNFGRKSKKTFGRTFQEEGIMNTEPGVKVH